MLSLLKLLMAKCHMTQGKHCKLTMLSLSLSNYLCVYNHLSFYRSIYCYIYRSIYICVHVYMYVCIHLSIYLCMHVCMKIFIYLSITFCQTLSPLSLPFSFSLSGSPLSLFSLLISFLSLSSLLLSSFLISLFSLNLPLYSRFFLSIYIYL